MGATRRNDWQLIMQQALALTTILSVMTATSVAQEPQSPNASMKPFVGMYCIDCHDGRDDSPGINLNGMLQHRTAESSADWERVIRKLRTRQMPPDDAKRPTEAEYNQTLATLSHALDVHAIEHLAPGRTDTIRRLNRTEYQNSVRDLLALDIDVASMLPADQLSHGFDNITLGELSPTLLSRYITAAQKIARLAVGGSTKSPGGDTFRIKADITQEEHVVGLPLGTRGGTLIPYTFPQSGQYDVQVRLARDRNEEVEGLRGKHTLLMLLDRREVARFTIEPPQDKNFSLVDAHLRARVNVSAGPHKLGVTFLKNPSSLLETKRQPFQAHFNRHRHPRLSPAVFQVSVTGPYEATGTGDTPSRRVLFGQSATTTPRTPEAQATLARHALTNLMHRAFRRPIAPHDLAKPMRFFEQGREAGGFDAGMELAVSSILVSPQFLLRVKNDPPNSAPGSVYRLSDLELATRLSFFLWSSVPDSELLKAAEQETLHQPDVLRSHVTRMLADPRSGNLVTNFAAQWLHLRNLETITPDLRLFPDFDDNLRQSLREETEQFVASVFSEDRSVVDLLDANYTFLNERLARHYGIPHIHGSRFRKVVLPKDSKRGGLLRNGSVLTVTSYATRTSPVIRGNWILENLIGSPAPPPPNDVPALRDNTVSANLSVRERLAEHRNNAACAKCHRLIDPVGFSLENFDAVGRWRDVAFGRPIDSTGGLPGISEFNGVGGLESALIRHPELFVSTFTEKLLTFALGRGIEHHDGPAIRRIVQNAKAKNYRLSAIILGIVNSTPFKMRQVEATRPETTP